MKGLLSSATTFKEMLLNLHTVEGYLHSLKESMHDLGVQEEQKVYSQILLTFINILYGIS